MPNTGRRSGACYSCKRMKVRCGEERPSCRRCLNANRSCPGYAPPHDIFRLANVESKGRLPNISNTVSTEPTIHSRKGISRGEATVVYQALPPDREACGVSMFIHHYTIPSTDPVYGGHMGSLPEFYSANKHVPYLRHAMLAVSHALMAHDAKSEALLLQAREYRAQALQDLRLCLVDEQQAKSDQVLLSLFLLERFELLSGKNQSAKVWYSHSEGFSTLLRLRGSTQFNSPIGRDLLRWINVHLSIRDHFYGTRLAYPGPVLDPIRSRTSLRQSYFMQRMGELLQQLKAVQERQGGEREHLLALIDKILADAIEVRAYLEAWHSELPVPIDGAISSSILPSSPRCHAISTTPGDNIKLATSTVHCFRSFTEGSAFNFYWTLWIRWARFVIDCYRHRSWLESSPIDSSTNASPGAPSSPYTLPPELPPEILQQLSHAADQAARTVPFMTGEVCLISTNQGYTISTPQSLQNGYTPPRGCAFGCWASIWHLNNIVSTPEIDVGQPHLRAWAMTRLLDLRDRVGIKQAGAFYDLFAARMVQGKALRNLFRFEQEQQLDKTGH